MEEVAEFQKVPEQEIDPRSLAIVTTTLYPNWYPGEQPESDVERVRGNLAIKTIKEVKEKGLQLVIVDGGSSEEFKSELTRIGVVPLPQLEQRMSVGRQQGFKEAAELPRVKVICWTEPEKVSLIRDCLPQAVLPILTREADIVVPKRENSSFETYPDYQVRYEQKSNRLWNAILRSRGLLRLEDEDLDVWFGPKFFKNDPELIKLFMDKYGFIKGKMKLHEIVRPELWPNAIFLPIVAALYKGYKVLSVPVPYLHPKEQTGVEEDNPEFVRRRDIQRKNIIVSTIHLIRLLEESPKSRLKRVT